MFDSLLGDVVFFGFSDSQLGSVLAQGNLVKPSDLIVPVEHDCQLFVLNDFDAGILETLLVVACLLLKNLHLLLKLRLFLCEIPLLVLILNAAQLNLTKTLFQLMDLQDL